MGSLFSCSCCSGGKRDDNKQRRSPSPSHEPKNPNYPPGPFPSPLPPVPPKPPTPNEPSPTNSRGSRNGSPDEGCAMRAMFAFLAENKSEISLFKGKVYTLIDSSVDEWSYVKPLHSNEEGYVPSAYLQLAHLDLDPDWYFGYMERLEAVRILQNSHHGIGNFIIRKTYSRPNGYALSLRCRLDPYENGAIKHYIITLDNLGRCYINEKSRFQTMEGFIDYYTRLTNERKGQPERIYKFYPQFVTVTLEVFYTVHAIIEIILGKLLQLKPAGNVQVGDARHCGGLDVALVAPCEKEIPPIPNRTRRDLKSLSCIEIKQIKFSQGRLGRGNFGEVFKASIRNRTVAVKTLNTNTEGARANFLREAEAMNKYRHPNLVEFICMSFDESSNKLYLVSEFMSRGDLANFLNTRRRTNEPTHINYMLKIGLQVLDGMCYLEKYQVVHRDLRAANVLVGDGDTFKISDFGLLIDKSTTDLSSKFPIRWTAPEAMRDVSKFSTKSDVWSYGLLMIEVTSLGVQPYPDLASFRDVQRYVLDKKVHPKPGGCPEKLYGILLSCWSFDAVRRPTFEGLKNLIEGSLLDKDGHYAEE